MKEGDIHVLRKLEGLIADQDVNQAWEPGLYSHASQVIHAGPVLRKKHRFFFQKHGGSQALPLKIDNYYFPGAS